MSKFRSTARTSKRSLCGFQRLESRQLLAADGFEFSTNLANAADVNADGQVTALDALMVINRLSPDESLDRLRADSLSSDSPGKFHLDVNGDGRVTPADALRVINELAGYQVDLATAPDSQRWAHQFGVDSIFGSDIHSDLLTDATLIEPAQSRIQLQSHVDVAGDVDWFRVPVTSSAITLGVFGNNGLPMSVEVFSQEGVSLRPVNQIGGDNGPLAQTFRTGDANSLLLKISSQSNRSGTYSLELFESGVGEIPAITSPAIPVSPSSHVGSLASDDMHGDSPVDATLWHGDSPQSLSSSIDQPGAVDVFRIDHPIGVLSLSVSSAESSVQIDVLDGQGNVLTPLRSGFDDNTYGVDVKSYDAMPLIDAAGRSRDRLFIRVSAGDGESGNYTLLRNHKGHAGLPISSIRELEVDDYGIDDYGKRWGGLAVRQSEDIIGLDAHAGSISGATNVDLLAPSTEISSFADSPADSDTFSFTAVSRHIRLDLQRFGDLGVAKEGNLTLQTADGMVQEPIDDPVDEVTPMGVQQLSQTFKVQPGVQYFATVSNPQGGTFGRYSLSLQTEGDLSDAFDFKDASSVSFTPVKRGSASSTFKRPLETPTS